MINQFEFSYSELTVGILAFISAVLVCIIKIQHDKISSIKNQLSDKKYNVYNEIFSIFFDIMRAGKGYIPEDSTLPDRVIKVKKDLLIYGTDEINRKFIEWHINCNTPNQIPNFKNYISLFLLIRKDMEYKKSKLTEFDILDMITGNKKDSQEIAKLMNIYKKKSIPLSRYLQFWKA